MRSEGERRIKASGEEAMKGLQAWWCETVRVWGREREREREDVARFARPPRFFATRVVVLIGPGVWALCWTCWSNNENWTFRDSPKE